MLGRYEEHVIDAARRLVEARGQAARDYLGEVIAIAGGRATPGRLEELAEQLAKRHAAVR